MQSSLKHARTPKRNNMFGETLLLNIRSNSTQIASVKKSTTDENSVVAASMRMAARISKWKLQNRILIMVLMTICVLLVFGEDQDEEYTKRDEDYVVIRFFSPPPWQRPWAQAVRTVRTARRLRAL